MMLCRRRLSRLDVYRVDTYSRVLGATRAEVRASGLGRSCSADSYVLRARARARAGAGAGACQTDGRMRSCTPRPQQSSSHWAYFRWPHRRYIYR